MKYKRKHQCKQLFHYHDTVHDTHSNMRRHKPLSCVKLFNGNFVCAGSDKISGTKGSITIQLEYRDTTKDLAIDYFTNAIDT